MSTSTDRAVAEAGATVDKGRDTRWLRGWRLDVLVCLAFVALAGWLTGGLWGDPDTRTLALNPADQTLVEWFLAYGSRVWTGDFDLVTGRLNAPDGINLLTNAATVGLGAIFAPVTWLFGAPTTFAVIMGFNLAATASGWYLLFVRVGRLGRVAAAVGAVFCGFAPGMISQANSHLHMTAQWLVPPMIWCVITLARSAAQPARSGAQGARMVGTGVLFGLLVALQVFIGEETLLLLAMTLVIVTVVYIIGRRPPWEHLRRFAGGLMVAVGVAAPLLIYPLWLQFNGPQSVPNGVFSADYFYADLASFPAYSPLSWAGSPENARLSTGASEYNTFLGGPLILLTLAIVVWLRRNAVVVACFLAALAMAALSLGPRVVIARQPTSITGPYSYLHGLPVIDGALPMRFALAAIPLIGVLLAIAWDRAAKSEVQWHRFAFPAAAAVALIPLAPLPLPTTDRAPVPAFFSEGHWRECAQDGDVIVPVPLATPPEPEPMRFATATDVAFGMPEGFFIGPYGREGRATVGTWKVPTSALLADVAKTGRMPVIDEQARAQARMDLARWDARCVVLTDHLHQAELRLVLEELLGPGRAVSDAIIWPISEP